MLTVHVPIKGSHAPILQFHAPRLPPEGTITSLCSDLMLSFHTPIPSHTSIPVHAPMPSMLPYDPKLPPPLFFIDIKSEDECLFLAIFSTIEEGLYTFFILLIKTQVPQGNFKTKN